MGGAGTGGARLLSSLPEASSAPQTQHGASPGQSET